MENLLKESFKDYNSEKFINKYFYTENELLILNDIAIAYGEAGIMKQLVEYSPVSFNRWRRCLAWMAISLLSSHVKLCQYSWVTSAV